MKVFGTKALSKNLETLKKHAKRSKNGRLYLPFKDLVEALKEAGFEFVEIKLLDLLSPATFWLPKEEKPKEETKPKITLL